MAAGEWLVCFACGLRHTPRPDGQCPRCKAPSAEPEPDAAGAAWRPPPPQTRAPTVGDVLPAGARVAGWIMIANGAVGLVGALRVASLSGSASTVAAAGALAGAAIGLAIVNGSDLARRIAVGLSAIALPALLVLGAATQAWAPCAAGALLCLANLALLVGDAGPARLVPAALVLAGGVAAGVSAALDPASFATKLLAWAGAVDSATVSEVRGPTWRMTFPAGRWHRAKRDFGGGPASEGSFLRPDGPAFATVLPVNVRGLESADPDLVARLGSESVAARFDRWKLLEVAPLEGRGGTRVLHGVAKKGLQEIEVLCGLFPNGPLYHVVVVGAAPKAFAKAKDELAGVLASFRSDTLPMPSAPTPVPALVPPGRIGGPRGPILDRGALRERTP